jgi:SH3-like domain-containing protein
MRRSGWLTLGIAALGLGVTIADASAQQRKTPYYASISAGLARMRTGPGRNYPAIWLYRRADLPVRVVAVYNDREQAWRKVEDPDGTQGWMQANLLSERRTALVIGTIAELRERPEPQARVQWRAAPGVVGRISKCAQGWCHFDVKGRDGYVEQSRIWGTDPGETLD